MRGFAAGVGEQPGLPGWGLARFAEVAEAQPALVSLVLGNKDTAVTRATAEALLRRFDTVGLRLVATALASGPRRLDLPGDQRGLGHRLPRSRRGATHLLEEITSISPVLIAMEP
ncbi:hypothetical protein G3I59_16965 [Amycolatopsis rubida]|uniref:Uncharacterized protein n=1 Tax=Amycolatopsis rubida TaxID=112413 RepID=A0ABX0BQL3_9PSEU|nr:MULTISPECIES: hypothetical protein [Amycolatopsis]MYW92247.1 hypothetical protein [Amycolatopsis rubida]NEC57234.1 hypothetical protein [Amycolatopsis rubida]OAP21329.1 hypothetical protein A4R44_07847 [Amycolatopsis sp. M39]